MRMPPYIQECVQLAGKTTLNVGGAAEYFLCAKSLDELHQGLLWAQKKGLPIHVIGGGSNIVISDAGLDGLVVQVGIQDMSYQVESERVYASVGAGVDWDTFVRTATQNGWAGIECLVGIPGHVGASPIQNIGAYGQEFADVAEHIDAIDLKTMNRVRLSASECQFGYRNSLFKAMGEQRYLITSVGVRLQLHGRPTVRYRQLQDRVGDANDLMSVMNTVADLRREKGMLAGGQCEDRRSAGSFFMNPVLSTEALQRLKSVLDTQGIDSDRLPAWPQQSEDGAMCYKLAAAWLIEQSGLHRGFGTGPVGLSTKHALALVNRGGANAEDVLRFARQVQSRVRQTFDVELRAEPVFLGTFSSSL